MTEVAYEKWSFTRGPNHWVLTGQRSFLGRWSLLIGGALGRSREVLIIEHWLGKKLSRWVVASCKKWSFTRGSNYWALTGKKFSGQVVACYGRFDCILSLRVTMPFSNFDWFFRFNLSYLFSLFLDCFRLFVCWGSILSQTYLRRCKEYCVQLWWALCENKPEGMSWK